MIRNRLLYSYLLSKFKKEEWKKFTPAEKKEHLLAVTAHWKERWTFVKDDRYGKVTVGNPYETDYDEENDMVTIWLDFNDTGDIELF